MSKLPNIQILRAIAASTVVLYHSGIETSSVCLATARDCALEFWIGGFGVGLFFVISGFIMVATSWNAFGTPGAALAFMKRRIIRIVPLYWLLTTVAVVGVFFVPSMLNVPVLDPLYVVASYLFWPVTRINGLVRPIANLGWTLNLEMMFYVIFTVSLLFNRRMGMILAIGFLTAFTAIQMTGIFSTSGALSSTPLNFWADPIIINFILGMIFAVFYKRGFRFTQLQSLGLFAVSAVLAIIAFNNESIIASYPENSFFSRTANTVPPLFLFLACALGPQLNEAKKAWRPALLIGDASYSLYLIHPFALRAFSKIWVKVVGVHLPIWSFTVACLMLAVTVGLACYYLAERPLLKLFSPSKKL
jgi:exopolysaccharide production protein ExoZ